MENKKQSSVDYLIKEFSEILGAITTQPIQDLLLCDAIKKAKELNKEEIKESYNQGYRDSECDLSLINDTNDISNYSNSEEYYNKTFIQ